MDGDDRRLPVLDRSVDCGDGLFGVDGGDRSARRRDGTRGGRGGGDDECVSHLRLLSCGVRSSDEQIS